MLWTGYEGQFRGLLRTFAWIMENPFPLCIAKAASPQNVHLAEDY